MLHMVPLGSPNSFSATNKASCQSISSLYLPSKIVDFSGYFLLEAFYTTEAIASTGTVKLGQSGWHNLNDRA